MNTRKLSTSLLAITLTFAGSALADPAGRGVGNGFGREKNRTVVIEKGNAGRTEKTVVIEKGRFGKTEKTVVVENGRHGTIQKTVVIEKEARGRGKGHRGKRVVVEQPRRWGHREVVQRPVAVPQPRPVVVTRPAPVVIARPAPVVVTRPAPVVLPPPRPVVVTQPAPCPLPAPTQTVILQRPVAVPAVLTPPIVQAATSDHGSQVQKAKVHTRNTLLALTAANELRKNSNGKNGTRALGLGLLALNEILR